MSMTSYSAHVYVVSEEEQEYFEISFPNEMEPELLIKETFINDFNDPTARKALIDNSFDANYSWEDEDPYTLENAISDWWDDCGIPWFDEEVVAELDEEDFAPNQYDVFCKTMSGMRNIKYVLLAVDANKPSHNYGEYWYDAVAYDFAMQRRVMIDWRGDKETHEKLYGEFPFDEEKAQKIVTQLEKNQIDNIDIGDFVLNNAFYGKVTVKDIQGSVQSEKTTNEDTAIKATENAEEAAQIERISSLITNVDEIDFSDKAFVFDRLDYVPINGEFHGPDSPEHPVVKKVIEAGGLMRKNVSGKTDYLVLNNHAAQSGMGKKCKDALAQIDKGKDLTIITVDNLMEILPSSEVVGETKSIKANSDTDTSTLTFNNSKRVIIDGDLFTFIPDGFHYAKDGFGGNQNWLYFVPEDYSLELDHIDAKPFSFGIIPHTITTLPELANVDNIDVCKEFLLANNMLQQGVAIKECICSEHCFFIFQTWLDSKDNLYNKMNGVLFAGDRMYQFHTFMNHDKAISDDEKVIRQFELTSRIWMKHVVLSDDPVCKAKGDPEEVKATIADVTRIIKQYKEAALPALSDDFGNDFKDSYSLIAAMFYLKNGKQIDTSRIQSLRNMIGQDLSKESLMTLLRDHEAQESSITDIIRAPMHDRVMSQTVLLDKFAGTDIEGGMTWVHFIGVEELLKVLCEENNIDYDLNEYCLECVESIRTLFSEKWESGDAYRLNESTFVIHQRESERRWNKPEKPKEKTSKDKSAKKEKPKQDSEKEKKSLQRKIARRKRELETLSSELEQLERVGDNKENKAKYIENVLEEKYRSLRESYPVDWLQEPEIEKFVKETDDEFGRLRREYKKNRGYEMHEIKSGVYSSLYDPELQYHVERLQTYTEKYIKDLTRIFKRVESRTERFREKGITASSMKKLVDIMDAIYKEGEEIKISFNDSVNEVTMVYEYMPVECGISVSNWRSHQEYMPDDIDEQDRQKEAKANKSMQEKLNDAQTAYEKVRNKLKEAENESAGNGGELKRLEEELEGLLNNYDAEAIIIEDDCNDAVDKLQRQLEETVQRKDNKIQEKRELEAALERTVTFAFSKKNKYKEEISTARSEIRQLEYTEEDLEERIRKVSAQKERRIKSMDSNISDFRAKIAEIKKQIETAPDRIASLEKLLVEKETELLKAQQEADSFHIDYLIREHGDILHEMSKQIINKQKRIEKLKSEIAQFEKESLEIE